MQTKTLSNLELEFPALENKVGGSLKGGGQSDDDFMGTWWYQRLYGISWGGASVVDASGSYWGGAYFDANGNYADSPINVYGTPTWITDRYYVIDASNNNTYAHDPRDGGPSGDTSRFDYAYYLYNNDPNAIHNLANSQTFAIGEALGFAFDLNDLNVNAAQRIATNLGADLEGFRILEGVGGIAGKLGYVGLAVDGVQTLSVLMKDEPWTKADYAQVIGSVSGAAATILLTVNPGTAAICAGIAIGSQIYEWYVQ